jgi:two-component system, NtrC family, sensor kinase
MAVPAPFDRTVRLRELLGAVPRARTEAALNAMIGTGWRLVEPDGQVVWEGTSAGGGGTVALVLELQMDVLGRLEAPAAREPQARVASQWLELVLASARRYQMAADLHLEAVHADFQALQEKHSALQASEARYRALSHELEQRVQSQVALIERTQRQMFQSAQMAAIGSLAAGMAHEINNPVGFVRSNLATATEYLEQLALVLKAFRSGAAAHAEQLWARHDLDFVLADFAGLLAESAGGVDRIGRIIGSLRAYASVEQEAGPADVNEAVRSAGALLREQLPAPVALTLQLQPVPLQSCDLARLQQAVFALLHNAWLALGNGGGAIAVATTAVDSEIRIAVRDNGCGMSAAVRERIFEPFFTTRDVGAGMGLGLTVANDIVRAHRGRIEVESAPGAGTTVVICLPRGGESKA